MVLTSPAFPGSVPVGYSPVWPWSQNNRAHLVVWNILPVHGLKAFIFMVSELESGLGMLLKKNICLGEVIELCCPTACLSFFLEGGPDYSMALEPKPCSFKSWITSSASCSSSHCAIPERSFHPPGHSTICFWAQRPQPLSQCPPGPLTNSLRWRSTWPSFSLASWLWRGQILWGMGYGHNISFHTIHWYERGS